MGSTGGGRPGSDADRRSQATVLGAVFVIGLVITGSAVVVTLGATALRDTQSTSELSRAENTMTLFDTRTAMVALGDSPKQTVGFGAGGGSVTASKDRGWLRIAHVNYTGSGDDEVIFNKSLGAVVYRSDNTEIAYQGGGVWRKQQEGDALMVSPPEFRYRDATLTLPLIRIGNGASGGGGTKATITRADETRRVFPNYTAGPTVGNETGAPYNGTNATYANPIRTGVVNVTVHSQYYQGWAEYFRQRTDGRVKEFPAQNRVRVTLVSLAGDPGEFEMPAEGNSIEVQGVGSGHPINVFNVTLADGNSSGKDFNNAYWSLYVDKPNEKFELQIHSQGKCNSGTYNKKFDLSFYYYNSALGAEEEWRNEGIDPYDPNNGLSVNCTAGLLHANLTTVNSNVTYDDIEDITGVSSAGNKYYFGSRITDHTVNTSSQTFDIHSSVDPGTQYTNGSEATVGFITNHYLELLGPEFNLIVKNGPASSDPFDLSESSGELKYPAVGGEYLTFLHVTENNVSVAFD